MENMKKETRNKRILFLVAVMVIGFAYFVSGQDVRARGFRDNSKGEYDVSRYFNIALITYADDELSQTDSITVFIHIRDSLEAKMFHICEKTDLYLAYDKMYLISISRKGYSTANLLVNAGVKVKEYGTYIPVHLEKGNKVESIGGVVWDSRINDIHYYPEPRSFR